MAKGKNRDEQQDDIIAVEEVKVQAQDFFEKNQKIILAAAVGFLVGIGGYLAYKFLYAVPREKSASEEMFQAEFLFARDSFAIALDNPAGNGFLQIIDNYGGTDAANLAKYYAGVSYLNLGQYDSAIKYLNDYDANDDITPMSKNGALGDAYAETGDMDKAMSFYNKAASAGKNELLTPYYMGKAALLNFKLGKTKEALELFKKIKADFPQSNEAKEAEKYIVRLEE